MSAGLALPDPKSATLAGISQLAEQSALIREHCREVADAETADELRRRLAAVEKYVHDREARGALERELRLTELLIGELLGEAQNRGPATTFTTCEGLNHADRNRFRALAANRELVEQMLERGVTKRNAIRARSDRLRSLSP